MLLSVTKEDSNCCGVIIVNSKYRPEISMAQPLLQIRSLSILGQDQSHWCFTCIPQIFVCSVYHKIVSLKDPFPLNQTGGGCSATKYWNSKRSPIFPKVANVGLVKVAKFLKAATPVINIFKIDQKVTKYFGYF